MRLKFDQQKFLILNYNMNCRVNEIALNGIYFNFFQWSSMMKIKISTKTKFKWNIFTLMTSIHMFSINFAVSLKSAVNEV